MELLKIPFDSVEALSAKDIAYATQPERFLDFLTDVPSMEGIKTALKLKKLKPIDRTLLVNVLKKQYQDRETTSKQAANIEAIAEENTFTIITAHQPCLMTGPLYYVYKILSTIHLAESATKELGHTIVPVFISGGEDHDLEELNHFQLFNDTIRWEPGLTGAVGAMPCDSLQPVLEQIFEKLGASEHADNLKKLISSCFLPENKYGRAMLDFTNALFAEWGLIVLDAADIQFKIAFKELIKQEVLGQVSRALIQKTQEELDIIGFSDQAFAREINFFYLQEQLRTRIVKEDGLFKVLETDLTFTPEEMQAEIDAHPERFSPNVVMRPLFQEFFMPNLAYIGGGGEIAYWLERKRQFEHFGVPFPILIRRNSILWIDAPSWQKMSKLGLSVPTIFQETNALINWFVHHNAPVDIHLEDAYTSFAKTMENVESAAANIDPTLAKKIAAEGVKMQKQLEKFESWMKRAEKQKHEQAINQLERLKSKLFPNRGLQERKENFIPFYLKYGPSYFDILKQHLNPLEQDFLVFVDKS